METKRASGTLGDCFLNMVTSWNVLCDSCDGAGKTQLNGHGGQMWLYCFHPLNWCIPLCTVHCIWCRDWWVTIHHAQPLTLFHVSPFHCPFVCMPRRASASFPPLQLESRRVLRYRVIDPKPLRSLRFVPEFSRTLCEWLGGAFGEGVEYCQSHESSKLLYSDFATWNQNQDKRSRTEERRYQRIPKANA